MGHRVIYSSRYVTYGGQNYVKPISVLIYVIGCLINDNNVVLCHCKIC